MSDTHQRLCGLALGLVLLAAPTLRSGPPRLVWNATASVPLGLYRVIATSVLKPGDMVLVRPPPPLADLLDRGGYLPRRVPLLKPVAALAGQRVCRDGLRVAIDGAAAGVALAQDRRRRTLPSWRGCVTLSGRQVFLLAAARPDSFDGRYFGPLDTRTILGRALPVWTLRSGP